MKTKRQGECLRYGGNMGRSMGAHSFEILQMAKKCPLLSNMSLKNHTIPLFICIGANKSTSKYKR